MLGPVSYTHLDVYKRQIKRQKTHRDLQGDKFISPTVKYSMRSIVWRISARTN